MAHNSSRFDQILINKTLANKEFQEQKVIDTSSIKLIPKSYEIYLTESFNFHCSLCSKRADKKKNYFGCPHYPSLKTIDSLNHLQSSLDNLTNELKSSVSTPSEMKVIFSSLDQWIRRKWVGKSESEYEEILLKCVKKQNFPYGYVKSVDVLAETSLPPHEEWKDIYLDSKKPTSLEEVKDANEMFHFSGCKNLGDYYDFYLNIDIELLCCVVEAWRKLGKETFSLDPMNFISLPSYGFSVWLYLSGVEIELLQNIDQILMTEGGKRGGWSGTAGLRYAEANHRGIPKYFTMSEAIKYLIDADICALYSHCMEFGFPIGGFRTMSEGTLRKIFDYFQETKGVDLKVDSSYSFHLVCDLEIDKEQEELLSIFPPLVENKVVTDDMISPFMKKLKKTYNIRNEGQRLISDLSVKENYVINAFALKNYVRCGVRLRAIKAGICYRQETYIKKQMQINAQLRRDFQAQKMTANANSIKRLSNSRKY